MSSFEDSLKTTLLTVNEAFDVADADLHREVAEAARGLQRVTEGAATLTLKKTGEGEQGAHYSLFISGSGVEAVVGQFHVHARGYPVSVISTLRSSQENLVCNDSHALTEYFSKLASNPDSGLVTQAAYIMRKKSKTRDGRP